MIKFFAASCWVIAFILSIVRHWAYMNIERLQLGKDKQGFIRYFFNDIGDGSIMLIEPISDKFQDKEKQKLKKQVNMLTYIVYLLILISIVLCFFIGR